MSNLSKQITVPPRINDQNDAMYWFNTRYHQLRNLNGDIYHNIDDFKDAIKDSVSVLDDDQKRVINNALNNLTEGNINEWSRNYASRPSYSTQGGKRRLRSNKKTKRTAKRRKTRRRPHKRIR